jgi:3-oxoacyl-[acyl-carrier-protein] synthase-3
LGCSGYVYGLSLCDGLIRSGAAKRILFITAETYTKLIDKQDRTLRTIFGDGAAATLIESNDEPSLWAFKFGTDGKGANTLLATENGFRNSEDAISPRHRRRWKSDLYMDGPALINFTVGQIPGMLQEVLKDANITSEDVGYYLFHQATYKMLSQLQQVMEVDEAKVPILLRDLGNTVSSTLPILINQMRSRGDMTPEMKNMLVGFGVGWSWAGCVWQDVARP